MNKLQEEEENENRQVVPSSQEDTSINLHPMSVSDYVLDESSIRLSDSLNDSSGMNQQQPSVVAGGKNAGGALFNLIAKTNGDNLVDYHLHNNNTKSGLVYSGRERLKLKDFDTEVRAIMDVEQFLCQAEVLLDTAEVSLESIVDSMLNRLVANDKTLVNRLEEIRNDIFIPGSSMLVSKAIQGVQSHHNEVVHGDLSYDQSWLCALCELTQLSKRHMIVARFKCPLNMGENARAVRLFVLIVAPTDEKGTKNALETGRTFATLLCDAKFRQRLLEARNDLEFKSLMMVRAQRLSKLDTVKNRHKYGWNAALQVYVSSIHQGNDETVQLNNLPTSKSNNSSSSLVRFDSNQAGNSANSIFGNNPRTSKLFDLILETDTSFASDKSILNQLDRNMSPICSSKEASCNIRTLFKHMEFGKSLWNDFTRRAKYYKSDFVDGFVGPPKTLQKSIATIWFLYFGILLPTIAFSALNTAQTHGHMGDLRKAIIGQAIGGLVFALFGGQPLVIIMTTAPLCLYTKVIHQMCLDYGFHFPAMYAAVGLWNGLFLIIYSLFGFSRLMKWCTRSTEEVFALFIVVAFITDACKDMAKNFNQFYYTPACDTSNATLLVSTISPQETNSSQSNHFDSLGEFSVCRRETSILFVLLMLATLWLGTTLCRFKKTPYLDATIRELLADYALPAAVIIVSFFGSFVFSEIYVEKFPPVQEIQFQRAQVELLSIGGILTAAGLGFTLSLLFFMDQNISAAMVNAPQNGLKKGCAYHFDLMVIAILNGFLALYGLPMMHGVLPHSPLHVRNLADIEHKNEDGHLQEVISNVRETRVTGVLSHILVLASLLLIPYPIAYIPRAVLNGLFLYMAVTSLDGLQMFERIQLIFTEQRKYPPNHYIRKCPQSEIHKFTLIQVFQLVIMCLFGFSPYNIVEMFFPVIILLMIPFRHNIVTKYINHKYLDALDGKGH